MHSGRQAGGLPMQYSTHEQIAWPFASLHWLYGPHGDGMHGLCMAIGALFFFWSVIKMERDN